MPCSELGVGFVVFSPLARGLLAGGITDNNFASTDIRSGMPRFQSSNFARNLTLAERFNAIAADAGCTPAQLSLGWVLSRAPFVVTIPGTRSIAHVVDDLAAATAVIDASALKTIDILFAPGSVAGGRYAPAIQAQIDTELLPSNLSTRPDACSR